MPTCTADDLTDLSKCFIGLSPTQQQAIATYLLCQIASNGGVGAGVPSGVILMWSGRIDTIPIGWAFCDGTSGTPDLRDRFVVCARQDDAGSAKTNLTGSLTVSGGSVSQTHGITDPQHTHAGSLDSTGSLDLNNDFPTGFYSIVVVNDAASTGITVNSQSAPQPYYALAYIMKL